MSDVILDEIEKITWSVYRGQDAQAQLTLIDTATGDSEILSTTAFKCSFRAAVNESSSIVIDLATGSGITTSYETGDISIALTDTQTAALSVGTYYGQLWRNDSGEKQPVCLIELVALERGTVI